MDQGVRIKYMLETLPLVTYFIVYMFSTFFIDDLQILHVNEELQKGGEIGKSIQGDVNID